MKSVRFQLRAIRKETDTPPRVESKSNLRYFTVLSASERLPQYPEDLINTTLSEVNFKDRKLALQQKPKTNLRILPFVTQYQPSVPNLKQILMKNCHLIEKQPLLSEIYKKPPSYLTKEGGRSKTYSWEPNYEKAILNTRWGVVYRACQPRLTLIVITEIGPVLSSDISRTLS